MVTNTNMHATQQFLSNIVSVIFWKCINGQKKEQSYFRFQAEMLHKLVKHTRCLMSVCETVSF